MLETKTCPRCGNDFAQPSETSAALCDDCRRANEPAATPSVASDAREHGITDEPQGGSLTDNDSQVSSIEDDLRAMLQRVERKIDDELKSRKAWTHFSLMLSLTLLAPYCLLGLQEIEPQAIFPVGLMTFYGFLTSTVAVFSIWLALSLRTWEEKIFRLLLVVFAIGGFTKLLFEIQLADIIEPVFQFVIPFSFACFIVAQAVGAFFCVAIKPPLSQYRSVPRASLAKLFLFGGLTALLIGIGRMFLFSDDLFTYLIAGLFGGMFGLVLTVGLGATHSCKSLAHYLLLGIAMQAAFAVPVLLMILFMGANNAEVDGQIIYAAYLLACLGIFPIVSWILMRKFGHEVIRERRVPPAVKRIEETVDPFQ